MRRNKILNDMQYWQLREDLNALKDRAASLNPAIDEDKAVLKSTLKEINSLKKTISSYEKKKLTEMKKQSRKEAAVQKKQKAVEKKKEEEVIFSISPIESAYFDFKMLSKTQRSHLIFKKKQFLDMAKEGMYVQLYDDDTLYRIRKGGADKKNRLYIVSVKYGEEYIRDIALIVHCLIPSGEIEGKGQVLC